MSAYVKDMQDKPCFIIVKKNMSITLADLKTRVDDRRRDITNSFVGSAEITRYLNEAGRQLQFENDWDFTQRSDTISYVDGTNSYALSAIGDGDVKEPIELFYTYEYKFTYVSPEDFDYLKNYSYDLFAIDGDNLKINTSFGSQTLTFDYYSTYMAKTSAGSWQEELSADTDVSVLPNSYRDILVDYAVLRIAEKEGNANDVTLASLSWDKRLNKLKEKYWSKAKRTQIHMLNPRDYQNVSYDRKEDPIRSGIIN